VKTKTLPILAIATVLFLFASPTVFATSSHPAPQLAITPLTVGAPAVAGPAGTSCKSGGCTYVANYGSASVTVISPSDKVLTTISLPSGSAPIGVAYDAKAKMVFVADYGLSAVDEINPATNKFVKDVTGFAGAAFIACDDAVPACFVTQFAEGTVTSFNPTSLKVGSPVTQCAAYPEFITFDTKTSELYVGNREACITVQDPKTGKTTDISVGDSITGVAAVKNGEVYADDGELSEVFLIKGTTVKSTITNSGFDENWGNTVNVKGTGIYTDSAASDQVYQITGTTVGSAISVGSAPNAACTNLKNNWIYVTNLDSDTVSVISGNTVLTTVNAGTEPFGCGVN